MINHVTIDDNTNSQAEKMISRRLDKAVSIAALAHAEQLRKKTATPYIVHPFRVMHIANQVTDDEDVLIACLFHDILEDAPEKYSREQMLNEFGSRVVGFVEDVTKDDSIKDWRARSKAYLEHIATANDKSVIVCAADKINNLNAILIDFELIGEELWQRFGSDKHQQFWFYNSVYTITQNRLPDSPLCEALSYQIKEFAKIVRD